MAKEAYKGHRAGSTKGLVHKRYDEKGADSAVKLAVAQGIKEATAKTWCSFWKNDTGGKKKVAKKAAAPAKKPAAKKTAKKAAPAKKTAKKSAPKKKSAPRVRPEFGPDAEKAHASA